MSLLGTIPDSDYDFSLGPSFQQLAVEDGTGRVGYGLLLAGFCISNWTSLIQTMIWAKRRTIQYSGN
jgi:hypothetical protein